MFRIFRYQRMKWLFSNIFENKLTNNEALNLCVVFTLFFSLSGSALVNWAGIEKDHNGLKHFYPDS